MDGLSTTLILVIDVKSELEKGLSVSSGVQKFIDRNLSDPFTREVIKWRASHNNSTLLKLDKKTLYTQQILISILSAGGEGVPILDKLKQLELDLIDSSEDIIKEHILKLPLLMLIPLMLFIFPAIIMILLGPLLMKFM